MRIKLKIGKNEKRFIDRIAEAVRKQEEAA